MVRDANGRIQAIVGDIPGLLCVKCVWRCFSGNLYELISQQAENSIVRYSGPLLNDIYENIIHWSFLCFQFSVTR